jgi:hypothetical protein
MLLTPGIAAVLVLAPVAGGRLGLLLALASHGALATTGLVSLATVRRVAIGSAGLTLSDVDRGSLSGYRGHRCGFRRVGRRRLGGRRRRFDSSWLRFRRGHHLNLRFDRGGGLGYVGGAILRYRGLLGYRLDRRLPRPPATSGSFGRDRLFFLLSLNFFCDGQSKSSEYL